jgi:DNA invertase Pin-like site-specific DNA recombinase
MRAVIYARYSAGPKQTEQSIEGQVRVCTEYCQKNGLTIQEVYADRHISGKTDDRPEFRRLIADGKKKKFDAVVVYKTDRFARNKYDSAIYKRQLKQAGVKIYYAAESIPEGPEGIILESLMEGLAEYYSAELSQKVRRGMYESATKAHVFGGSVPFGLRTKKDHSLEPDPNTAPAVKKIFEKYVDGESGAEICRWLNSHGYKTSQGRAFNKSSITRIIKNKKYIGIYEAMGVTIPDAIEPIVPKDLFYLAQKEMDKKKRIKATHNNTAEYLLSGKLFCGHCGNAMQGISGTSKTGAVYYYYACGEQKKHKCSKKPVKRDWIEERVVRLTVDFLLREDRLKALAHKMYEVQSEGDTRDEDIAQFKKKLNENAAASANIMRALEKGLATDTLLARLDELESERVAIEGEIAFLKTQDFGLTEEQLEFFLYQFLQDDQESPEAYRKKIIKCFITKVFLYDDKIKILYSLTKDGALLESEMLLSESSSSDASALLQSSLFEHQEDQEATLFVFKSGLVLTAPV